MYNRAINFFNAETKVNPDFSHFPFPPCIIQVNIAPQLDLVSTFRFSATSKSMRFFFKQTKLIEGARLLYHVTRGEQIEAEWILKKSPELALQKKTVIDPAGRTFKNITAFQYALWALDRHMWVMLLKYLSPEEINAQLQEHLATNPPAYIREHGPFFSFDGIKNAYQDYVNYFRAVRTQLSWGSKAERRLRKKWLEVGKAQRALPIHVIHEYCNPYRSFGGAPLFNEERLHRSLQTEYDDVLYPLSKNAGLGIAFTLVRGREYSALADTGSACGLSGVIMRLTGTSYLDAPAIDAHAITHLCTVRNREFVELTQSMQLVASLRSQ